MEWVELESEVDFVEFVCMAGIRALLMLDVLVGGKNQSGTLGET